MKGTPHHRNITCKPDKKALAVKPEYIVTEARNILNAGKIRMKESHGCYWLDGKPVHVGEIIKAANIILHRVGMQQLGKCKDWLVE